MSHFLTSLDLAPQVVAPARPTNRLVPARRPTLCAADPHRGQHEDMVLSEDEDDANLDPIICPESPIPSSADSRPLYYLTELPAPPRPSSPPPPRKSPSTSNPKTSNNRSAGSASPTPLAGLGAVAAGKVAKAKSRKVGSKKKDVDGARPVNTLLRYFSASAASAADTGRTAVEDQDPEGSKLRDTEGGNEGR